MATPNASALDWCHKCTADTPTTLAPMACGHVGRLCALCSSLRHPRPWATKDEYRRVANTQPVSTRTQGYPNVRTSR